MIWSHWNGASGVLLKISYFAIILEVLAILPFGFVCPIEVIVNYYWSPDTRSILFPGYIAEWFIEVGAILLIIAVGIKVAFPYGVMRRTEFISDTDSRE